MIEEKATHTSHFFEHDIHAMNMATTVVAEKPLADSSSQQPLNSPPSQRKTIPPMTMNRHSDSSREELQFLLQIAESWQPKPIRTTRPRQSSKTCAMTQSPDGCVLDTDPQHPGLYFAAAVGERCRVDARSGVR